MCVAAKWQPGPPGAAQLDTGTLLGWDLGHWWLLILLIHPRGAISAQSCTALHQVTWPSSAPGPISTQLPANDFTVIVTTVNTIIYTSIHRHYTTTFPRHWSHQGGILDFLFLKAYSVAAIQNLFDNTIILHVDWLIKSCF